MLSTDDTLTLDLPMDEDEHQKWETESLESLSPSAYDELMERGEDGESKLALFLLGSFSFLFQWSHFRSCLLGKLKSISSLLVSCR